MQQAHMQSLVPGRESGQASVPLHRTQRKNPQISQVDEMIFESSQYHLLILWRDFFFSVRGQHSRNFEPCEADTPLALTEWQRGTY